MKYPQQVPLPKTAADVPGPAAGTVLTKEYVPKRFNQVKEALI